MCAILQDRITINKDKLRQFNNEVISIKAKNKNLQKDNELKE